MRDTKDFKLGDKVQTIDGKVGKVGATHCIGIYALSWVQAGDWGNWYPNRQLARVEAPKPPESGWLLTREQAGEVVLDPGEARPYTATVMAGARAQLRHVVEGLRGRNLKGCAGALCLTPEDWEELQREAGLSDKGG